jgi:hypothetical protein
MDEDKSNNFADDILAPGQIRDTLSAQYWDHTQFAQVFKFASGPIVLAKSSPLGVWWAKSKF